MPFDFGSFVNAGQFSDPANYSGFNGQMSSLKDSAEKAALASLIGKPPSGDVGGSASGGTTPPIGVAPPTNPSFTEALSNYASSAVAPLQQKFNSAMQFGSNVSQGNYGAAANQLLGGQPQKIQDSYTNFKNAIDRQFNVGGQQ